MTNQDRIKEYLVGEKGYLKSDISNGKVIMLSGKWGSGKTHFWQNIIEKEITDSQKKKQKAYVYSSLYGNTALDKIEDNIYAQAYFCSIGGKNIVISGYEKVKDFGKRFGSFCSLLDVSKLVAGLDDIQQKNIKESALSYLENGGIVCFDDFERKSKYIDLNDLFGYISHLAIDLNCKVVIILNDDVFEGEEKDIFSNVKEKTVSKFLKYEPSIEELFKTIFYSKKEKKFTYLQLRKYRNIILKTIEETKELNARIYFQVLDNLLEWIDNDETEKTAEVIRCLILVDILFETNHCVFSYDNVNSNIPKVFRTDLFTLNFLNKLKIHISKPAPDEKENNEVLFNLDNLRNMLKTEEDKKIVNNNKKLISKFWNYHVNLKFRNNIDDTQLEKINNFIETGILID